MACVKRITRASRSRKTYGIVTELVTSPRSSPIFQRWADVDLTRGRRTDFLDGRQSRPVQVSQNFLHWWRAADRLSARRFYREIMRESVNT
jgi:hypothetical protein